MKYILFVLIIVFFFVFKMLHFFQISLSHKLFFFFVSNEPIFQLNKKRRKFLCFVWKNELQKQFMNWWITIIWYEINQKKSFKNQIKIHWKFNKKDIYWIEFAKKITKFENIFKIICRKCQIVFAHSTCGENISSLKKHLNFKFCKKKIISKKFDDIDDIFNESKYKETIKRLS